jgi:hypothetical protein
LPQFSRLLGSNLLHIPSPACITTAPQVLLSCCHLEKSLWNAHTSSPYCKLSWRKTIASKKNSDVAHISDEMVGVYSWIINWEGAIFMWHKSSFLQNPVELQCLSFPGKDAQTQTPWLCAHEEKK